MEIVLYKQNTLIDLKMFGTSKCFVGYVLLGRFKMSKMLKKNMFTLVMGGIPALYYKTKNFKVL